MSKVITFKLTRSSANAGPFTISDEFGNIIATGVSINSLISGVSYTVSDSMQVAILESTGTCKFIKKIPLQAITIYTYTTTKYVQTATACLWRHLTDIIHYNFFYNTIHPYIIEYPFAYQYQDEILQCIKDYTKAYKYLPLSNGVFDDNLKVETNDEWFNKAILYNGQQSSGILNLVAKPQNNLQAYNKYPVYNTDSKTITFTKSDNFYQYNTFWALNKSSQIPLFNTSCVSLSIDKTINQDNMDYGKRSFKKSPIRSKDLRVRHQLDDKSDIHLVSQFLTNQSQISYK